MIKGQETEGFSTARKAAVDALHVLVVAQLAAQFESGLKHSADPFWTDIMTDHNVGQDELQAVRFMQAIDLEVQPHEVTDPEAYAGRLIGAINAERVRFRAIEPDPDGYGAATFGEVVRAIEEHCAEAGLEISVIEVPLPDQEWYELERRINDAKAAVRLLVRRNEMFLLMDQVQIAIFLTLIRLYRTRDQLSDAEIIYYIKEIHDLRSIVLLSIGSTSKFMLVKIYRYIAGLSNLLSSIRHDFGDENDGDEQRLPYTCFGFDLEAGQRGLAEEPEDTGIFRTRIYTGAFGGNEDTLNGQILSGLLYLESIATPTELGFLQRLFPTTEELVDRTDGGVIYHYLEAHLPVQDDAEQYQEGQLFCLYFRRSTSVSIEAGGWNCGKTTEIAERIHQLRLVTAFSTATNDEAAGIEAGNQLYSLSTLLRPGKEQEPEDGESVFIVAEGPAALFPFAAMSLRTTGEKLVSRASLTLLLDSHPALLPSKLELGSTSAIVLSVSDAVPGENLAALPHAANEGSVIAGIWNCEHFQNEAASPELFSERLGQHELIHIATHGTVRSSVQHLNRALATTNPVAFLEEAEAATKAAALLAGGRNSDGSHSLLSSQEIMALDLSGAKLVFLSLCNGAAARAVGADAAFGIAHSVIRAGAQMVVATLLPVEDSAARVVATKFHERLAMGQPPAEALRQVQLEMAKEGYGWHVWAGYQIMMSSGQKRSLAKPQELKNDAAESELGGLLERDDKLESENRLLKAQLEISHSSNQYRNKSIEYGYIAALIVVALLSALKIL